jgi:hypothetical protein
VRTIVTRVAALFPLPVVGIDLLVKRRAGAGSRGTAVVVEVNPGPAFAEHERAAGAARLDLAHAIVEHLFPEPRTAFVPVLAATSRASGRLAGVAAALRQRSVWPVGYSRRRTWSGEPSHVVGHTPASAGLLAIDARAQAILFEADAALLGKVGLPACHVDAWLSGGAGDGPAGRLLSSLCPADPLDALSDADVADVLMSAARQGVTLHA